MRLMFHQALFQEQSGREL
jgi:hypothetical protein